MEPQSSNPIASSVAQPMLTPIPKLLSQSFEFYRAHIGIIAMLVAVPFVASALQSLVGRANPAVGLLGLIFFIVNFLATIALMRMIVAGGSIGSGIGEAYSKSAGLLVPFIWISIMSGLASIGGFVLFIIPGIFLSVMLCMSAYSFIAEDKRGVNALIQSWNYVKGYWWPVFGRLVLVMVIIGIVTAIVGSIVGAVGFAESKMEYVDGAFKAGQAGAASRVGGIVVQAFNLFVFSPFSLIYSYFIYQSLRSVKAGVPAEDAAKVKRTITTFAIVGILALIIISIVVGFVAVKYGPQWQQLNAARSLPASVGLSPIFELFNK